MSESYKLINAAFDQRAAQAVLRVVERLYPTYNESDFIRLVGTQELRNGLFVADPDLRLVQSALCPEPVGDHVDLDARTLRAHTESFDGVYLADSAPLGSWLERVLWTRLSDEGKAYWRDRAQAVVAAAKEPPAVAAETAPIARRSKGTYAANSRSTKVITLLRRSQRDAKGVAKALGCSLRQARSSLDQLLRQGRIEPGKYRGTYRVAAK